MIRPFQADFKSDGCFREDAHKNNWCWFFGGRATKGVGVVGVRPSKSLSKKHFFDQRKTLTKKI